MALAEGRGLVVQVVHPLAVRVMAIRLPDRLGLRLVAQGILGQVVQAVLHRAAASRLVDLTAAGGGLPAFRWGTDQKGLMFPRTVQRFGRPTLTMAPSIIDAGKKAVVQSLDVPTRAANRLKFTLDGKLVLISDLGGNELVVVDAIGRKELKRIQLGGGAAGILMEPGGSRAYIALGLVNGVAIIDLKTLEVVGHIETGRGPDGLGWATRS